MNDPTRAPRRRHGPKPGAKLKRYPELSQLSARRERLAQVLARVCVRHVAQHVEEQAVAVR
jgi:hypothetical protein